MAKSCYRRPVRPESKIPLLVFSGIILITLFISSITISNDPYAKARSIQNWPIIDVSSKELIDECGVFMFVRWAGPGFDADNPYIPMAYKYQ